MSQRSELSDVQVQHVVSMLTQLYTRQTIVNRTGFTLGTINAIAKEFGAGRTRGRVSKRLVAKRTIGSWMGVNAQGMDTELTYEAMWGILGGLLSGAYAKTLEEKFKCTRSDIKVLADEYGISWDETKKARAVAMGEYGKNWQTMSLAVAQWQPAV